MRLFYFLARNISYSFSIAFFTVLGGWITLLFGLSFASFFVIFPEKEIVIVLIRWLPISMFAATIVHFWIYGFFTPIGAGSPIPTLQEVNKAYKHQFKMTRDMLKSAYRAMCNLPFYNLLTIFFSIVFITLIIIGGIFFEFSYRGTITIVQVKILYKLLVLAIMIVLLVYGLVSVMLADGMTTYERSLLFKALNRDQHSHRPFFFLGISWRLTVFVVLLFLVLISFAALIIKYPYIDLQNLLLYGAYILLAVIAGMFLLNLNSTFFSQVQKELKKIVTGIKDSGTYSTDFIPLEEEYAQVHYALVKMANTVREERSLYDVEVNTLYDQIREMSHKLERDDAFGLEQTSVITELNKGLMAGTVNTWHEIHLEHMGNHSDNSFIDIVNVDSRKLILASVYISGQGLSVALRRVLVQSVLRSSSVSEDNAHEILGHINNTLLSVLKAGETVCASIMIIDASYTLSYAAAACPVSLIIKENGAATVLKGHDSFLGLDQDIAGITSETVKLDPHDRVVLYADSSSHHGPGNLEKVLQNFAHAESQGRGPKSLGSYTQDLFNAIQGNGDRPKSNDELLVIERKTGIAENSIGLAHDKIQSGELNSALDILRKGLVDDPGNDKILFLLSKLSFRMKEYGETISYGERYINQDRNNKYAYYLLGSAYYQNNNFRKAILAFKSALKLDPKFAKAATAISLTHLKHGNKKEALQALEGAIEQDKK